MLVPWWTCGIVLTEGLGVPSNPMLGIQWLQHAIAAVGGSSQACFELGMIVYTGMDGVVEEDSVHAFELFEQAANDGHVAGMYMMADCLLEGEGTTKDVACAIPLLYRAAEQGHRYARQTIRQLVSQFDQEEEDNNTVHR